MTIKEVVGYRCTWCEDKQCVFNNDEMIEGEVFVCKDKLGSFPIITINNKTFVKPIYKKLELNRKSSDDIKGYICTDCENKHCYFKNHGEFWFECKDDPYKHISYKEKNMTPVLNK